MDDSVSLDVHAINELKDKGFAATDDTAKYCYTADSSGNYSELTSIITCYYIIILAWLISSASAQCGKQMACGFKSGLAQAFFMTSHLLSSVIHQVICLLGSNSFCIQARTFCVHSSST